MLQRIIAMGVIGAGAVAAGLGVASATVWRESDTVVADAKASSGGTLLVTDPGVLDLVDRKVSVEATGPGDIVVAIGREIDVQGWVADRAVTNVTGLTDWYTLATRHVAESAPAGEDVPAAEESPQNGEGADGEATAGEAVTDSAAPDPQGSDMWVDEASGAGRATMTWTDTPGRWMLLVASTGESAGSPSLELTWHREVATPWLWPGVAAGAVLALAGMVWLILLRRSGRTPRQGSPSATPAPSQEAHDSPGADDAPASRTPSMAEPPPITQVLTRREIREQEEAQRATGRPKRHWLTGSIPVVPRERRPKTSAQPTVEAATQEGRGDAWRKAWGIQRDPSPRIPVPEDLTATMPPGLEASPSGESGTGPAALPETRSSQRGGHSTPEAAASAVDGPISGHQAPPPQDPGSPTNPGHLSSRRARRAHREQTEGDVR